jgi:hypothetical protein
MLCVCVCVCVCVCGWVRTGVLAYKCQSACEAARDGN